jgi:hypothetical protein
LLFWVALTICPDIQNFRDLNLVVVVSTSVLLFWLSLLLPPPPTRLFPIALFLKKIPCQKMKLEIRIVKNEVIFGWVFLLLRI